MVKIFPFLKNPLTNYGANGTKAHSVPWNTRTLLVIDSPSPQMLREYSVEVSLWDCFVQLHGQQLLADAGLRMRQGGLALGYRHFVLWPHICCHVGKQQTLPFKTHKCQHLPFAVRKTWEKKEDTAIPYVAYIKYLANGLALAVSICFKNKDFCFSKVHSEGKILPDSSNLIGPQSILKVCICIQLYMQPGKKICKKMYICAGYQ